MNPVLVPLGDYQMHMLTRELSALVDMELDHPNFVDDVRTRLGATRDEVDGVLDRIRNGRAAA